MKVFAFFLFTLLSVQTIFGAEWKTECSEEQQPVPFNYCISKATDSLNPDVVFHFHGLGSSEKVWSSEPFHYAAQIREDWDERGASAPTIVSVSFGPLWLLVEKNSSVNSGLFEAMAGYILPFLEKKIGGGKGERILVGESMGGFNASQLFLKAPNQFNRVALICPAIAGVSPFSSEAEINAYIKRTNANPEMVKRSIFLLQQFVPDAKNWENVSQLLLAEKNLSSKSPALYLSCGSYDEYGFYEGAKKFLKVAREKNVNLVWRPLSGGHCVVDIPSLSEFISPSFSQSAK